jgi:hypothetical protein
MIRRTQCTSRSCEETEKSPRHNPRQDPLRFRRGSACSRFPRRAPHLSTNTTNSLHLKSRIPTHTTTLRDVIGNTQAHDVEPPPLPTLNQLAPQHYALPKTTTALTPASPTRAVDREYGRSREFDAYDGGSGAGYEGFGWVCGGYVSFPYRTSRWWGW